MAAKTLPKRGWEPQRVLDRLRALKARDADWARGRVFSLVYDAGPEVREVLHQVAGLFLMENALNPLAFPSLRCLEAEVVAMTASLLGGDEHTVGHVTSGGTESLLLAVKAARDWAREHRPVRGVPEIVAPSTVHPAVAKAAHYLGLRLVRVPVDDAFRADPAAMARALSPNTIMLVASAPSYPHGVMDPIPELAELARSRGLWFHVDACVGGFFLPFLKRLGHPVPDFDLRLPGVTSLSADVHKYGYALKGASVVLYRSAAYRRHQFFVSTDWPGGIYASAGLAGTRSAIPLAAAWAVMHLLGEEGYLRLTRLVMDTTRRIRQAIETMPELTVLGDPIMSIMAIASPVLNIYEVADELTQRGWHLDRQQHPPSLHLTVTPAHAPVVEEFLHDLRQAVAAVQRRGPGQRVRDGLVRVTAQVLRHMPARWRQVLLRRAPRWFPVEGTGPSAPLYGLMGTLPQDQDVREAVMALLDRLFTPAPGGCAPEETPASGDEA